MANEINKLRDDGLSGFKWSRLKAHFYLSGSQRLGKVASHTDGGGRHARRHPTHQVQFGVNSIITGRNDFTNDTNVNSYLLFVFNVCTS